MQIPKDEIRSKILSAARAEFLSYGFEKASIRRITSDAGTSKSNVYNYFKDKDALFRAVVKPALKAQADFFEAASARSRTADAAGYTMDAQKTAILGFMALMLENGDDFRLLFFCSDGSSLAGFKNGLVRSLADTLRDWVGRISPQTALPELFYRSVAGFYIGAVEQILLDGNVMKNAGLQMDAFLKFVYGGWSTILNQ